MATSHHVMASMPRSRSGCVTMVNNYLYLSISSCRKEKRRMLTFTALHTHEYDCKLSHYQGKISSVFLYSCTVHTHAYICFLFIYLSFSILLSKIKYNIEVISYYCIFLLHDNFHHFLSTLFHLIISLYKKFQ